MFNRDEETAMEDSVKMEILYQEGEKIIHTAYVWEKSENIVCIMVDAYGRAYPFAHYSEDYPVIFFEKDRDEYVEGYTKVGFPEYEGWEIFCVGNGGKTIPVTLYKRKWLTSETN